MNAKEANEFKGRIHSLRYYSGDPAHRSWWHISNKRREHWWQFWRPWFTSKDQFLEELTRPPDVIDISKADRTAESSRVTWLAWNRRDDKETP